MSHSPDIYWCGTMVATNTAASALNLPWQACEAVQIQCDPGAKTNILIGNNNVQTIQLVPGQILPLTINNPNAIYIRSVKGPAQVNILAQASK